MAKLTKKLIDRLSAEDKEYVLWDSELPGFGVRIKPSGVKSYCIQYRNDQGRSRRLTLGRHGRITVDQARKLARQTLVKADTGNDPAEEKMQAGKALTMAELASRFLHEHAEIKKKPKSLAQDRRMLNKIILPAMGRLRIEAITRRDIYNLHYKLKDTPYQANRVLSLLGKMLNLAEKWGMRPDGSNPTRHVERYKEQSRKRFLSHDEMARLGAVLTEAEKDNSELPQVILAIRVLLLTGCRLSEILTLEWSMVDFEQACLHLEDSKTGARDVQLNAPALELLGSAQRYHDNMYVIPGMKPGAHLVNLNKPWRRIRIKAGIPDVRLHDLRHSFATIGVATGLNLPIVGHLLGHSQAQTTARYAHAATDPLKAAAEAVGKEIAAAMSQPVDRKVVPFDRNGS